MRSWLPTNIFAINKRSSIGAGAFNHCASLCPCSDGVLLAWYAGTGECQDDQSVHVTYLSNGRPLPPIRIGDKTGNPIVWREGDKHWLLWSRFEDLESSRILATRWRSCSLWIQQVEISDGIQLSEPALLAEATEHLLARTNPLTVGKRTILPLYDEVRRQCVMYGGKDGQFEEISRYGDHIIQPAIWRSGDTIHSLSRNFGNRKKRSCYFFSGDAIDWRPGGFSYFKNVNNSLAVCQWDDQHVVLWNNTDAIYRVDMTLGLVGWNVDVPSPLPIVIVNKRHGSYPCLCVDDNDLLHFAYTDPNRRISYHVWNKKNFKRELKRSRNPA